MIKKIEKEILVITKQIEKDYQKSYEDMYNCYLTNNEPIDYHIGVSFVEGMERAIELIKKNKDDK